MRRLTCDQCRVEADLNEYGLPPAGWVSLRVQGPPFLEPLDLCSVACTIAKITPVKEIP